MRVSLLSGLALLAGSCTLAFGQSVPPGAPMPRDYAVVELAPPIKVARTIPTPATPAVDPAALQHDARELLELSQSLQPDIEAINRGLLPKDAIEKLKRIEKISKRLRGAVSPFTH